MQRTREAQRVISTLSRYYSNAALAPVIELAEKIAQKRGAPRLGYNHIDTALEQLSRGEHHRKEEPIES